MGKNWVLNLLLGRKYRDEEDKGVSVSNGIITLRFKMFRNAQICLFFFLVFSL